MFYFEIDTFHKERSKNFKNMLGQYAATQYLFSKKLGEVWKSFANELKFTKEMMDNVSKKNLIEIKTRLKLHLPEY